MNAKKVREKSGSRNPRVSIVMPTHNRPALLEKAIRSVREQSFADWELVVIDDASSDNTPEVLRHWQAAEPRIRVIRNGLSHAPDISKVLDQGLQEARGAYVARLDDDDWWCDPDKLKVQVGFLDSHPEYVVVGGGVIVVDASGRELYRYYKQEKDEDIRKHALFANPFSHTTTLFRREAALAVGGYGRSLYAEDWDLWLRLGLRGKLYNFPRYFTAYLMAGQNKSLIHQRAQARMILQFIKIHRFEYPGFLLAYALNSLQYLYSFLPFGFRASVHPALSYIKRRFF